jgi:UDP-N-acetylmuramoyl-tripeptide--D-alanyl-D-alanine ligase
MKLQDGSFSGFCVDTRLVQPGNLFFALKGARVDGHNFLQEAKTRGAAAAVVSKEYAGKVEGLQLIHVEDPLSLLQELAKEAVTNSPAKIVAITGSIGKTTTKDFTATLLKEKFRVLSFPGNPNSQIGLPLALLNSDLKNTDILVLEMSMDLPGQITKLTQIAPPDIALITYTALVHAHHFDSLEAIGRAKAEIFSHPKTQIGILHRDIVNFDELTKVGRCPKFSFSVTSPDADFHLKEYPLPVPGHHNLHNFLAAASIARSLGLSWEDIKQGAAKLRLPDKRFQILDFRGATFVNDSYNACEASVIAAMSSLPQPRPGGKTIFCLGEMPELGPFSEECHKEVGKKSLENIDVMLCLGQGCLPIVNCRKEADKPVFLFQERIKLVEKLRELLQEGDIVLLKGANVKQMWKVLEEL